MPESVTEPESPSPTQAVDKRLYLAYCDILGFSNLIQNQFDSALEAYRAFAHLFSDPAHGQIFPDVRATMYSDAILVTAETLPPVLKAVQNLWFQALVHDLMIRGAITHGRYWEERKDGHLFVVSDALVRAVKLERTISVPAVVIADDVEIPEDYWRARFCDDARGQFITPLLHFRDRNIVNPFNIMWGYSAGTRARQLTEKYPEHKDKYLWFLALYEAVWNRELLIPQSVFARFIEEANQKTAASLSSEATPDSPAA